MTSTLRQLDDRLVPDLARRTQRLAARIRAAHEAGTARVARLRPAPAGGPDVAGPAPAVLRLRALDARYASRGPLALMRDVPQLGALLVAALILVNGAAVAQRSDRRDEVVSTTPDGPAVPLPGVVDGGVVGPEIGDDVPDYLQKADRELQDRLVDDRFQRTFATVSFVDYRTPADIRALLGDVGAFRVFFRVPSKLDTEVHEYPVKDFVTGVLTAYETVAAQRRAEYPDLISQGETTDDPAFKADYLATARIYAQEAEALERGCACVFAVAVNAQVDALLALRRKTGVRVVDLAPAGAQIDTITFRGLRPEETVTVTNGNQRRDDAGEVVGG